MNEEQRRDYWRKNIRFITGLLVIWAAVSFGAGIFFVEQLNELSFIGFPLGFWFSQQGSIIVFVLLVAAYVVRMDRLDAEFGVTEGEG